MKINSIWLKVVGIVILIFGFYSCIKGMTFFPWTSWLQLYYRIAQVLILSSGLVYIVSSIFLFGLKNWTRRLAVSFSIVLLLYFIPLSIFLIPDPWGWGGVMALSFLPHILFPLFFAIFLTRPKVKEYFKK